MAVSLPFPSSSSSPGTPPLTPSELITTLNLQPHPEGGHYRQTFIDTALPSGRAASTAIYFLLQSTNFSAIHRLDASEAWHFYAGQPISIVELHADGPKVTRLGMDLRKGERPQYVVPANVWFGSLSAEGSEWALVGCTVAPGFEFERFELGKRDQLVQEFPTCREWILKLTRVE